jgi:hypothetical protein
MNSDYTDIQNLRIAAERFSGRQYPFRLTLEEREYLQEEGIVVIFPHSDDGIVIDGAMQDSDSAFGGAELLLGINGIVGISFDGLDAYCAKLYSLKDLTGEALLDNLESFCEEARSAIKIKAIWNDEANPCWRYELEVPHETFELMEGEDVMAVCAIIDLSLIFNREQVEADFLEISPISYSQIFNLEMPLPKEVPVITVSLGNAGEQVQAAIADLTKEGDLPTRDRPYNGQPWTYSGERGRQLVSGLTFRDICDCFVKGLLLAQPTQEGSFDLCWDFSSGEGVPTPYLLAEIAKNPTPAGQLARKVDLGLWKYSDVYSILTDYDPIAAMQNMGCEMEKMMGIYPNNSQDPSSSYSAETTSEVFALYQENENKQWKLVDSYPDRQSARMAAKAVVAPGDRRFKIVQTLTVCSYLEFTD